MIQDLVAEFLERLNEPDPPHALLLLGVYSASKWIKHLEMKDKKIIYNYMEEQLKHKGDLPNKELIIKVLQDVGGADSLMLIDKIITDGEAVHGKYIISDAIHAKLKLIDALEL